MASKSKKARQSAAGKRCRQGYYLVILSAMLMVGLPALLYVRSSKTVSSKNEVVSDQEAQFVYTKVQEELGLILTSNPWSDRLPAMVKNRISGIVGMSQGKALSLEINIKDDLYNKTAMMSSGYRGSVPRIIVHAANLFPGAHQVSAEKFFAAFVVAFYHETVHLELGPEMDSIMKKGDHLDEEVRAYSRASLEAVRPMVANGFPMMHDFERLDGILKGCGDKPQCPEFREAIRKLISGPR